MMISDSIESEFEINEDQRDDDMVNPNHNDSIVYDGPTVQSIKALRDHKLKLPGLNNKEGSEIEESARFGNTESFREGFYFDDVLSTPVNQLAGRLEENARNGLTLKEALIKAIKAETWLCVFKNHDKMNALDKEELQKKLLLERFQEEHGGFDFSDAQVNGNVPDPRTFMGGMK